MYTSFKLMCLFLMYRNSQYLPPELPCGVYNQSLADVWVMGIILYRMLVGKYPFNALNDRKLFSKMMHGDFSIPQKLSDGKFRSSFYIYIHVVFLKNARYKEIKKKAKSSTKKMCKYIDVKDLLRRMLAPGNARASLDLILFHPWLKPCSSIMLANNNDISGRDEPTCSSLCAAVATSNTEHLTIAVSQHEKEQEQPPLLTSPRNSVLSSSEYQHDVTTARPVKSNGNSSPHSIKKRIETKRRKERRQVTKSFIQMFYFLTNGPYPPPKQPYRELALLGHVHPTV